MLPKTLPPPKSGRLEMTPEERSNLAADSRELRLLVGFKGMAAVWNLTKERQRELVGLVVGRTRRESSEGVFVRMVKVGKGKRDVAWEWKLRGLLGGMEGTVSRLAAHRKGGKVKLNLAGNTSTAEHFARLLRGGGKSNSLLALRGCTSPWSPTEGETAQ